jgi:hypothetical protein
MYRKHLHLADNVDWPICNAMEGNRFEQEPENSKEFEVNWILMLLVAQLDGHPEEIMLNQRLMLLLLAAQLDVATEIKGNRMQMCFLLPEIEGNWTHMLLRFYVKFV